MHRYLGLFLVTFGVGYCAQQAPSPAQGNDSIIKAQAKEVIVDITVRDKKGHPVHDLSKADFVVYDNGVPQPVQSFRLVQGQDATSVGSSGGGAEAIGQLRLVTLLFDQMDLGERRMARQAALELLNQDFPRNVYMSVIRLDNRLQVIESFTSDRELLRKAIDRATGAPLSSNSHVEELTQTAERLLGPNTANRSMEQRVDEIKDDRERQLMAAMLGILRTDERIQLREKSRSVLFPLIAVVRGQASLPGRKSVLFFSQGFSVATDLEDVFKSVTDAANRSNVTFFAIDARGLQTTGGNQSSIEQLKAAARASMDHSTIDKVTAIDVMSPDVAADSGRYNTQDTLARLADATGGFLVANTNDLRGPVQRIVEEIETYYELSYTPEALIYDGRFHRIAVKTSRAEMRIQAKSGYFALPPSLTGTDAPLSISALALLTSLDSRPVTQAFPFQSGALHFRGEGREQICEIVIELALSVVTLEKSSATNEFEGGVKYLVLIKNSSGEVVKKLESELPVTVSADQLDSLRNTRFTNIQDAALRPGQYTVGVAVLDQRSGKTSARFSTLLVTAPAESLSMSSVALIRSWKAKDPDEADDDPLVFEGKTMTPTLTQVVRKSASTSLPFYLIVYPDVQNSEKPVITIEFECGGRTRRVNVPAIGAPDRSGRIQYLANAPIGQFEPGMYSVRFIAKQGQENVVESIALEVAP